MQYWEINREKNVFALILHNIQCTVCSTFGSNWPHNVKGVMINNDGRQEDRQIAELLRSLYNTCALYLHYP